MALSQKLCPPAPAHCHHHGRQRPLGKAAGSAPHRRSRRGGGSLPARSPTTASTLGVEYLTVYAFSTENWKRPAGGSGGHHGPAAQVSAKRRMRDMEKNRVKFRFFGDLTRLQPGAASAMPRCGNPLGGIRRLQVNFCLNYGGRDEIIRAAQALHGGCRRRRGPTRKN